MKMEARDFDRRLANRPGTRLTPVTPPPPQRDPKKIRYLFDVRCHESGRTCSFHGRRVKATSHKDAMEQVVLPTRFGPLHRKRKNLPEFVAFPKPETLEQTYGLPRNRGHMDVRHGAIYVRKVGDLA